MTIDTQKLREVLDKIEYELQASFNNAKPVCCGHGYSECCGNPEPGWDAGDQKIMDVLGPIQKTLSDALPQIDAQAVEIDRYRRAAERWQRVAESAEDRAQTAADEIEMLRGMFDMTDKRMHAEAARSDALLAHVKSRRAEIAALRAALLGLLDALPSATTHPAIKAARAALQGESHA